MNLFTAQINNWSEWGKLFQDVDTWHPLIQNIFQKEKLPFVPIEKLTPGTNAVFKVGELVIKIFDLCNWINLLPQNNLVLTSD